MTLALLVVGIFFGATASIIAHQKGRSGVRWFLIGFFLHIIGLIVVVLPPMSKVGVTKKCPHCAEIIKAEAMVCRHCGRELYKATQSEGA